MFVALALALQTQIVLDKTIHATIRLEHVSLRRNGSTVEVKGLIKNSGSSPLIVFSPISDASLDLEAFDTDGNPILDSSGIIADPSYSSDHFLTLKPGRSAPFSVSFRAAPTDPVASSKLAVVRCTYSCQDAAIFARDDFHLKGAFWGGFTNGPFFVRDRFGNLTESSDRDRDVRIRATLRAHGIHQTKTISYPIKSLAPLAGHVKVETSDQALAFVRLLTRIDLHPNIDKGIFVEPAGLAPAIIVESPKGFYVTRGLIEYAKHEIKLVQVREFVSRSGHYTRTQIVSPASFQGRVPWRYAQFY